MGRQSFSYEGLARIKEIEFGLLKFDYFQIEEIDRRIKRNQSSPELENKLGYDMVYSSAHCVF